MSRRIFRIGAGLAVLVAAVAVAVWLVLRASLPQLDGELALAGIEAPVTVQRDEHGATTIRGSSRLDLARATGFAHARDRFFQMDLARRAGAGELAALLGEALVEFDLERRRHRMRARAAHVLAEAAPEYRALLRAYSEGVNAGLDSLGARPWEYLALRAGPRRWRPEDTVLVVASMYFMLQADQANIERRLGRLHACLPATAFEFVAPRRTAYEHPLRGTPGPALSVPGPKVWDFSDRAPLQQANRGAFPVLTRPGSNNWAVAGARSATGGALVANDMHLGLRVPNTWYRLRLVGRAADGGPLDMTGVSLPGTPWVVAGSNGRIAWGFTNSYGDWLDLIRIETTGDQGEHYRVPDGEAAFKVFDEVIRVKGGEPHRMRVRETRWGPVIEDDAAGGPLVWRWVGHRQRGLTSNAMLEMETADSVTTALAIAPRVGIPAQNLVVGDRDGNIGWTVMGPIPARPENSAPRVPLSWRDAHPGWRGWLPAAEYPRVVNPDNGAIVTANNRVAGPQGLARVGWGGYDLGARAGQIADGLRGPGKLTPADMLEIQLDDRALFLARWRSLALDVLDAAALDAHPLRQQLRAPIENWSARAGVDASGYRLVREFRDRVAAAVFSSLTRDCDAGDPLRPPPRWEAPLWAIVSDRPGHLLDAGADSWREVLLEHLDEVAERTGGDPATYTWGKRNRLDMAHLLARALPLLGRWLNMPAAALPGDDHMPRVQSPDFGASERFAVSPGHEDDAYLHMPGGQSGHPLSPYYRAGHAAWVAGRPTPFLPGAPVHELRLVPPDKPMKRP